MRVIVPIAAVLVLLSSAPARAATPAQDLDQARTAFRSGEYADAISLLSSLLYPTARLADSALLAEAHLLLGVSYFETGKPSSAAREFEEALFIDPTMVLEAGVFSVEAVTFFKEKKEELERKARDDAEKARLAKERDRLRRAIENMVVIEKRRYGVNFIPFGAGQFQNGDTKKGIFFFVSQAVFGGTSLTAYLIQTVRYGFPTGTVPRADVDFVNRLQVVQITSFALFAGSVAWGIIDSLNNYKPDIQRKPDPQYLEEVEDILKERENDEQPKGKKKPQSNLLITPLLGPNTAGAAVIWEF